MVGSSVVFTVGFGVAPAAALCAANVTLPRIAPAPRRRNSRVPVRWTMSQRVQPRLAVPAPRSA
jgi:hypothetical protein